MLIEFDIDLSFICTPLDDLDLKEIKQRFTHGGVPLATKHEILMKISEILDIVMPEGHLASLVYQIKKDK